MHAASRLGRVMRQIRSFKSLHAADIGAVVSDLPPAARDAGERLKTLLSLQASEIDLIVDELDDIRAELAGAVTTAGAELREAGVLSDPAKSSPKRAQWLAEQAPQAPPTSRRLGRRELLGGA